MFRLGRLVGAKGPGIVLLVPLIDRMVRVDLRTVTLDDPAAGRDHARQRAGQGQRRRLLPRRRPGQVGRSRSSAILAATSQIAQTTLRSVLGKADLDTLLAERERLNEALQQIIDEQTEPWGIKVTTVEIKDVGIPQGMQRAMARQAEAERERRAKVINAEGEFQASERLLDAAEVMSAQPRGAAAALPADAARDRDRTRTRRSSSRCPIDLIKPLMQSFEDGAARRERARERDGCARPRQRPSWPGTRTSSSYQTRATPAISRGERKTTRPGRPYP